MQKKLSADHARMEEMLEQSRGEIERTRSQLEGRLADAQREREQARAERDRARAELEGTKAELRQSHARLEAGLARGEVQAEDEGGTRRAQRSRRQAGAEKRIAKLENELQAERELREDLQLALELLQKHQADDNREVPDAERAALERPLIPDGKAPGQAQSRVPAKQLPGAKPAGARREPQPGRSREDPVDGWGVPLEAFPVTEPEGEPGGVAKPSAEAEGAGRQPRFRHRLRRAGR